MVDYLQQGVSTVSRKRAVPTSKRAASQPAASIDVYKLPQNCHSYDIPEPKC